MKGLEIAWRTLDQEKLDEPCIMPFVMKGSYYSRVTGLDYWQDKDSVFMTFLTQVGANLCPQIAYPYDAIGNAGEVEADWANQMNTHEPEDILPYIESLPTDDQIERDFDVDKAASDYARDLKWRIDKTNGEVLFISAFGQADFMGPYNLWGYIPYLMAIKLYPEHVHRYYHYTATQGYWYNVAITEAVRKYGIAPYVYSGQDICANQGPLCSLKDLDALYFPELRRAIQPLIDNDVRIIWHCDGNIMPILDRLIDLGVSGLQGFQEEAGVDFAHIVQLKSRWGRPLIVWGCVSVTTTLPFGTVEDVKTAVRRCYHLAGPGRGFVLAPSSSVMPEVPDENITTFLEYGISYGKQFFRNGL